MRGDQKGRLNTVNVLGVCEDMCINVYRCKSKVVKNSLKTLLGNMLAMFVLLPVYLNRNILHRD